MVLSKEQWLVITAIPAFMSLVCFGRVGYMVYNNYKVAHTIYVDSPARQPARQPGESEVGFLLRVQRESHVYVPSGYVRKPSVERFIDHVYEWGEVSPWLFVGILTGGGSIFLDVTKRQRAAPAR